MRYRVKNIQALADGLPSGTVFTVDSIIPKAIYQHLTWHQKAGLGSMFFQTARGVSPLPPEKGNQKYMKD